MSYFVLIIINIIVTIVATFYYQKYLNSHKLCKYYLSRDKDIVYILSDQKLGEQEKILLIKKEFEEFYF